MTTDKTQKGGLPNALSALAEKPQSLPPPPSLGLASLLGKPEVRGLYYNGQVLQLDGYRFIGCRFDNCVLRVASENFELIQCVIDPSTKIEYSKGIAKLLKLFLGRYSWAAGAFPAFFLPTRNADGSETISDRGY